MRFDGKAFAWLNDDGDYMTGWNNITHEQLQGHLINLINQEITDEDAPEVFKSVEAFDAFLSAVGLLQTEEAVLSFKIDEGELLEAVSAPAIYAAVDEGGERTGEMLLRVGDYTQPVSTEGSAASINGFQGDISVEEYGPDDNKKLGVTFEAYLDAIEDSVELSFILDSADRPEIHQMSKGKLKKIIKDGGLVDLLKVVPSGESFTKPRDLDVGEYGVISIEENTPHPEYGRSWKVVLEGVGAMMTTGKRLNNTLARQSGIYTKWLGQGNQLTFAISKKEELSQGPRVDCGFFKRAPREDRLVAAAKPVNAIASTPSVALPQATQTVTTTAQPVKQQTIEHVF